MKNIYAKSSIDLRIMISMLFTNFTSSFFCYRGNVVMRATAKKQGTQDMEGCPAVDMNIDVGSDCTVKLPSKPRKSKTKRMILRMFRAFRMLTVIAAVNVPLYMMLLFKDWIGLTNEFLHSRWTDKPAIMIAFCLYIFIFQPNHLLVCDLVVAER